MAETSVERNTSYFCSLPFCFLHSNLALTLGRMNTNIDLMSKYALEPSLGAICSTLRCLCHELSGCPLGFCAVILTNSMKAKPLFSPSERAARISPIIASRLERCGSVNALASFSTSSNIMSKRSLKWFPRASPSEFTDGQNIGILSTVECTFMKDASSSDSVMPSAVLKPLIPIELKPWRIMAGQTCS